MISDADWQSFTECFPTLRSHPPAEHLLRTNGLIRRVKPGDVLYRDGDECTHLPMVVSGELLLTKRGEGGRAITLYRVEDGESCILSTLSILNSELFPAEATSRSSTTLLLVPAGVVRELIDRDAVLKTTHQELAEELGSSREVVSRLLKDWERQGVVELRRGEISIKRPITVRESDR